MNEKVLMPEIIADRFDSGKRTLELKIPQDLFYFDGHFDQAKILPGVVQVDWAQHYGRESFVLSGEFKKLEVVKFQQVIVPESKVTLEISNLPDQHKLYFAYSVADKKVSSGRIVFGDKLDGI